MPRNPSERHSEPLGETSDHIRAALRGDEASLAWLVTHISPLMEEQARQRLGPRLRNLFDPEDIVQEIWSKVLPRLDQLRLDGRRVTPPFIRYLASSVRYRIRDLQQRHLLGKPTVEALSGSSIHPGTPIRLPDPAARACGDERARELRATISRLPELQRKVLVLRGLEQVSLDQVSHLLDITSNHASVTFRRAIESLRNHLPSDLREALEE